MGRTHALFILSIGLALVLGCSQGTGSPILPDSARPENSQTVGASSVHLWGLWDVALDPVKGAAGIVPIRGADFTCNVTQFLQPPISHSNLMGITIDPSTDFASGYVVVDVAFTHPFPGLDVYTGFDVRGVCMGDGSLVGTVDPNVLYPGDEDLRVLNGDGLTRWFNASEFSTYNSIFGFTLGKLGTPGFDWTASLNGYKYYCDGLDSEDDVAAFFADPGCPNPRGLFSAGNTLKRRYILQFPVFTGVPQYRFQYAVIAGWEPPANVPPSVPDDFPISANCQEAYCISAADQSEMYYIGPADAGGTLSLTVRVFDHQGAADSSGVASEISAIHFETQGGLIPGDAASFDSSALAAALVAEDEKSATYSLEVPDVEPYGQGFFPVLIIVESADPTDYDPGYPGFDFPDGKLSAYYMTQVFVGDTSPISVTSIDPIFGNIESSMTGVKVNGHGFLPGAQVTLVKNDDPGTVVAATNEILGGGTLITCDFDLHSAAGVVIGIYDVVVTNSGGMQGQLDDGFEVKVPAWSYWWENIQYSSNREGRNPMATSPDPTQWAQMWSVPVTSGLKYMTPVVAYDKIFFTSSSSFYTDTGSGVYAYNLNTGAQLWSAFVNPSNITTVRYMAGFGFYKGGDGIERLIIGGDKIYCFNANTGAQLWTYDTSVPGDENWLACQLVIYNGLVVARGRIYHHCQIIDATTGSLLHDTSVNSSGEGGVSARDGKGYMVGAGYIDCVDIDSGALLWSTATGHSTSHWVEPLIDDGKAYVTDYYGWVMCFAAENIGSHVPGDLIWEMQVPSGNPLNGGVAKIGNRLFCCCAFSSPVYCIMDDGESAHLAWSSSPAYYFDCHVTVTTTPSYPNGVVLAPELGGTILCLDATNGSLITSISTGDQVRSGVSLVGEYMVSTGYSYLRVYHKP